MDYPIFDVRIISARRVRRRRAGVPLWIGALALTLGFGPASAPGTATEEVSAVEATGPHDPLTMAAGRLRAGTGEEAEEITDVTAYCLACHADKGEAEPRAHPADSPASNHPVDLPYPEGGDGYRAAGELDPALLLLQGRLTCVTCHAHDDARHGTVLPTDQSRLCRACHLM